MQLLMHMINLQQRQQVHDFIVLDLAIRSLQHDYTRLTHLKLQTLYSYWLEVILRALNKQYQIQKKELASQQIQLVKYERLDAYFSEITITTTGDDAKFLYANNVLKQDVQTLLHKTIHLIFSA